MGVEGAPGAATGGRPSTGIGGGVSGAAGEDADPADEPPTTRPGSSTEPSSAAEPAAPAVRWLPAPLPQPVPASPPASSAGEGPEAPPPRPRRPRRWVERPLRAGAAL